MARAEEIVPILSTYGKLDLFVSGAQADIKLSMPVKYKSKGLSFFFGKQGGIDFLKTFKNNSFKVVDDEIILFNRKFFDLTHHAFRAVVLECL